MRSLLNTKIKMLFFKNFLNHLTSYYKINFWLLGYIVCLKWYLYICLFYIVMKFSLQGSWHLLFFAMLCKVTVGASFLSQTIALHDSTTVKFEIWDTAGQERYFSFLLAVLICIIKNKPSWPLIYILFLMRFPRFL